MVCVLERPARAQPVPCCLQKAQSQTPSLQPSPYPGLSCHHPRPGLSLSPSPHYTVFFPLSSQRSFQTPPYPCSEPRSLQRPMRSASRSLILLKPNFLPLSLCASHTGLQPTRDIPASGSFPLLCPAWYTLHQPSTGLLLSLSQASAQMSPSQCHIPQ